jgi:F0F1-type ATP synthase assembly protein I
MARDAPTWSSLLGIGTASALILAAGFALGWWLDDLLHTSPIMVLVGILLGVAGAGTYTYVEIRKYLND